MEFFMDKTQVFKLLSLAPFFFFCLHISSALKNKIKNTAFFNSSIFTIAQVKTYGSEGVTVNTDVVWDGDSERHHLRYWLTDKQQLAASGAVPTSPSRDTISEVLPAKEVERLSLCQDVFTAWEAVMPSLLKTNSR